MHLPYKVNFSTANLLLNSYLAFFHLKISIMCDTIIMFNLIIASLPSSRFLDFTQHSTLYSIIAHLDMKMRPRPAANTHRQEKKTRKYYIYLMF